MTWIQTLSGKPFDYSNPDPDSVNIFDIAQSLSNLCRFTGHVAHYWSVAQHSVCCSYAPEVRGNARLELTALLHDAHEAYVGDVNSPLKRMCSGYQEIEAEVQQLVLHKFNASFPLPMEVHTADLRMLSTERARLLPTQSERRWPEVLDSYAPYRTEELSEDLLKPRLPHDARQMFIERFMELRGELS